METDPKLQLANLLSSIMGDLINIREGIINDKQHPRMEKHAQEALDLLRTSEVRIGRLVESTEVVRYRKETDMIMQGHWISSERHLR